VRTHPLLSDLNSLFATLREAGIAVGPHEIAWLQHAFSQQPTLDRAVLYEVLVCTLVKDPDRGRDFKQIFEVWCPDVDVTQMLESNQHRVGEPLSQQATTAKQWRVKHRLKTLLKWGAGMLGIMMLLAACGWWLMLKPVEPAHSVIQAPLRECAAPIRPVFTQPIKTYYTWVPHRINPPDWIRAMLQALITLFSGGLAWWLWHRYQRKIQLPGADSEMLDGPDWLPLPRALRGCASVLTAEQTRTLIWGVNRFVSEEITTRLDVDKTVTTTAKAGGLPEIHYQPAVYPREVWLWQDEMTDHPLMEALVAEVTEALAHAALPVRIGYFSSTPDSVYWQAGERVSPLAQDGHRQNALVAILTDGEGILRANQSARRQERQARLLRALAEWPHLTFVGLQADATFAPLLQHFGLACCSPQALPAFLGAALTDTNRMRSPIEPRLLGERRIWASALALSPQPVSSKTAAQLRVDLGLRLTVWEFDQLTRVSGALTMGAGLSWSTPKRIQLLNGLSGMEARQSGELDAESFLVRSLAFWLRHAEAVNTERVATQNPLQPWAHTLASRRLRLDMALLRLWQSPESATEALYGLSLSGLDADIATALSTLAPEDWRHSGNREDAVYLPWKWSSLEARTQSMLDTMQFGVKAGRPFTARGPMRIPSSLAVALGLSAGVGLTTLVSAIGGLSDVVLGPAMPSVTQFPAVTEGIRWQWTASDNVVKIGKSEYWHTGTLAFPIRGCESDWPDNSLVIIEADVTDKHARALAATLLDKGSANGVMIGPDWQQDVATVMVNHGWVGTQQTIIIAPKNARIEPPSALTGAVGVIHTDQLAGLLKALDFSGVRPVQAVWGDVAAVSLFGHVRLRGGPEVWPDEDTGMAFVRVCGGSFAMGSDRYSREKPVHTVMLNEFQISRTEVTNAQYQRKEKKHPTGDDLPVAEVSWEEATAYCDDWDSEAWDYGLASEAQWEYAARGGTDTPWSFGNDEAQLDQYAWFDENSSDRAHPVCEKAPNPLGLYDIQGNVWEWTADCYAAYTAESGLVLDPQIEQSGCSRRVFRGGSFFFPAHGARAARRGGVLPRVRDVSVGFRCVRVPRRQP